MFVHIKLNYPYGRQTQEDRRRSAKAQHKFGKNGVQSSAETFVVNQTLVFRINTCCENRYLRYARKCYSSILGDLHTSNFITMMNIFFDTTKTKGE